MTRNFKLVGSPLSCPHILSIERNRTVSIGGTASNFIRNLALHTSTGVPPLTRLLNGVLEKSHRLTGHDPNDPDTTYHGTQFRFFTKLELFDSFASCFPHLMAIALAALIALRRPNRFSKLLLYGGLIAASGLLFCALLRWQPWHARIHLTYFLALLPLAGAILNASCPRWLLLLACLLFDQTASYSIFNNRSRPILDSTFTSLPRERQYGRIHADQFFESNRQAIRDIIDSGATRIGLRLRFNDPEYLLWLLLQENQFRGRMDHYMPFDASALLDIDAPDPDVLIIGWQEQMPPQYTNGYPYRVNYGWLKVHWSDKVKPPQRFASYWSEPR